jgi:hypothetical protein
MSEVGLTNEDLAKALRVLFRSKLQKTDLQWAYCKAASVLSFFDLGEVHPLSNFKYDKQDAIENLLPDSEIVYDEDQQPQWQLRSEVRKEALQRLHHDGQLEEALNTNPSRRQDTRQVVLNAYLLKKPPDLSRQTRQQLLAILQVSEWLQDLKIEGVPNPEDVRQKIEVDGLFETFRYLVGTHFQGREKELSRLTEYVKSGEQISLSSQLRSLIGWREKPILFIYGPGGIGKSTLLAKFILNCEELKDEEHVFFTYIDFDRPSLSAEEPITILLEALRQLAIQYPESGISLQNKREEWMRRINNQQTQSLIGPPPSRLSPTQRKSLYEALLDAFNLRDLERMLLFHLGKRLYDLVSPNASPMEVVFKTIQIAEMENWTADLVRAARISNPENLQLLEFVNRYPEFNPERSSFRLEDRGTFLRDFASEIRSLTFGEKAFLLILDTFEEVQLRSRVLVEQIFAFLNDLGELIPNLRTVLSGRAEVSNKDLERFRQEHLKKLEIERLPLSMFDPSAAQGFLRAHGVEVGLAEKIAGEVGGMPLTLKLAADLLAREVSEGNDINNPAFKKRFLKELRGQTTLSQLYTRILDHIRDPDVRKLAHPGLTLRRITPELILRVLAKPCKIDVKDIGDAQKLFDKLSTEVALVTQLDEKQLVHRPDLRSVMIGMLKRDMPDTVNEIHRSAVRYYESSNDNISRVEEIYHSLSLGLDRERLQARWREGLDFPSEVIRELSPKSQTYLAARLNVEIEEEYWEVADLEDWELHAARRARALLNTDNPLKALKTLQQRAERTSGSALLAIELEALIDVLKEMQEFFTIYRDIRVTRVSAVKLYEATIWCLNHYEVSEESEDYIRVNLSSAFPWVTDSGGSVIQLFEEIIAKTPQKSGVGGGEVEVVLSSLLEILRRGDLKLEPQAMLSKMRTALTDLMREYERQVAATS